jgi:hypothetical protein
MESPAAFTNETNNMCICSFISLFLILLFIVSPLKEYVKISLGMKLIVIVLLAYTIKMNVLQIQSLNESRMVTEDPQIIAQINTNIMCSYIFSSFLGILIIFVSKTFF